MDFMAKHFSKLVWGTFLVSAVGVGYIANCNNKLEKKRQLLLENTLVKADTNRDGILQNKELSGLLRDIGCHMVIPDNKNVVFEVGSSTFFHYRPSRYGAGITFGEGDLERYLSEQR